MHLEKSTFDFLRQLAIHNSKEWMDENRGWYQEERERVIALTAALYDSFATVDTMPLEDPRKSIFRINNNRRFQPELPLYKTNFGINLKRGEGKCGFYLHIEPGACFAGGGLYHPPAEQLAAIRQLIDEEGARLESIIKAPDFVQTFNDIHGAELKTAPRDYPKDHPYIHLLRKKDFTVIYNLNDELLQRIDVVPMLTRIFKKALPFLQFIDDALAKLEPNS